MASNTPQQITSPPGVDAGEVWIYGTTAMTINTTSATAAAGFPLSDGLIHRIPLNVSNSGTPTARQTLWVNTVGIGTVSLLFLGIPSENTTFT